MIWQGNEIATVALPPLWCAPRRSFACGADPFLHSSQGDVGIPNLVTTAVLTITDQTQFTAFATFILLNPE